MEVVIDLGVFLRKVQFFLLLVVAFLIEDVQELPFSQMVGVVVAFRLRFVVNRDVRKLTFTALKSSVPSSLGWIETFVDGRFSSTFSVCFGCSEIRVKRICHFEERLRATTALRGKFYIQNIGQGLNGTNVMIPR